MPYEIYEERLVGGSNTDTVDPRARKHHFAFIDDDSGSAVKVRNILGDGDRLVFTVERTDEDGDVAVSMTDLFNAIADLRRVKFLKPPHLAPYLTHQGAEEIAMEVVKAARVMVDAGVDPTPMTMATHRAIELASSRDVPVPSFSSHMIDSRLRSMAGRVKNPETTQEEVVLLRAKIDILQKVREDAFGAPWEPVPAPDPDADKET